MLLTRKILNYSFINKTKAQEPENRHVRCAWQDFAKSVCFKAQYYLLIVNSSSVLFGNFCREKVKLQLWVSESLRIVLSILNIVKQCLQVCQSQREEFKHLTTSTSRGDNDKSLAVQFNFNLNFVLMYIVYS